MEATQHTHAIISQESIQMAKAEFSQFRVTKVDKNPGTLWIMCPVL